eukprot:GHVN01056069.1.p1 GENE.GHVN01056069.1~~GHVN01056069.1.p1  ORF type:complete len:854 (+),score=179.03 GHVN01056069.1:129-2690(+)
MLRQVLTEPELAELGLNRTVEDLPPDPRPLTLRDFLHLRCFSTISFIVFWLTTVISTSLYFNSKSTSVPVPSSLLLLAYFTLAFIIEFSTASSIPTHSSVGTAESSDASPTSQTNTTTAAVSGRTPTSHTGDSTRQQGSQSGAPSQPQPPERAPPSQVRAGHPSRPFNSRRSTRPSPRRPLSTQAYRWAPGQSSPHPRGSSPDEDNHNNTSKVIVALCTGVGATSRLTVALDTLFLVFAYRVDHITFLLSIIIYCLSVGLTSFFIQLRLILSLYSRRDAFTIDAPEKLCHLFAVIKLFRYSNAQRSMQEAKGAHPSVTSPNPPTARVSPIPTTSLTTQASAQPSHGEHADGQSSTDTPLPVSEQGLCLTARLPSESITATSLTEPMIISNRPTPLPRQAASEWGRDGRHRAALSDARVADFLVAHAESPYSFGFWYGYYKARITSHLYWSVMVLRSIVSHNGGERETGRERDRGSTAVTSSLESQSREIDLRVDDGGAQSWWRRVLLGVHTRRQGGVYQRDPISLSGSSLQPYPSEGEWSAPHHFRSTGSGLNDSSMRSQLLTVSSNATPSCLHQPPTGTHSTNFQILPPATLSSSEGVSHIEEATPRAHQLPQQSMALQQNGASAVSKVSEVDGITRASGLSVEAPGSTSTFSSSSSHNTSSSPGPQPTTHAQSETASQSLTDGHRESGVDFKSGDRTSPTNLTLTAPASPVYHHHSRRRQRWGELNEAHLLQYEITTRATCDSGKVVQICGALHSGDLFGLETAVKREFLPQDWVECHEFGKALISTNRCFLQDVLQAIIKMYLMAVYGAHSLLVVSLCVSCVSALSVCLFNAGDEVLEELELPIHYHNPW